VEVEGVKVLRVEGGLFFANDEAVRARVREHAAEEGVKAIVLDAETMAFVDVSAVRTLAELREDLDRAGVRLLFARDIGQVRDVVRHAADPELARFYPTIDAAVEAALRERA
jgi:anti-anti-sigma factor